MNIRPMTKEDWREAHRLLALFKAVCTRGARTEENNSPFRTEWESQERASWRLSEMEAEMRALLNPTNTGVPMSEAGEFPTHDGWKFKRLEDGSIRIRQTVPGNSEQPEATPFAHTLTPNEWESVVTHLGFDPGWFGRLLPTLRP